MIPIKENEMKLSDWQKLKIENLAEYQETMADIYTILSERIPDKQGQLLSMAVKNLRYGDWLRSLTNKILNGDYQYEMMRFKIESISTGLNYLRGLFDTIYSNQMDSNQAIGVLKSVETGDIAHKFYEIINVEKSESQELAAMVEAIKSEKRDSRKTLNHFFVHSGKTHMRN